MSAHLLGTRRCVDDDHIGEPVDQVEIPLPPPLQQFDVMLSLSSEHRFSRDVQEHDCVWAACGAAE